MRKVLYSPGFGAGWVTWNRCFSIDSQRLMLEWEPLVKAVEAGEKITEHHPAIKSLEAAMSLIEGESVEDAIYCGGLEDLEVATGTGMVLVEEYDGSESLVWQGQEEGWL